MCNKEKLKSHRQSSGECKYEPMNLHQIGKHLFKLIIKNTIEMSMELHLAFSR